MVSELENENAKILKWQDNTPDWSNRWISVKDRLPEDKKEVLIYDDSEKDISIGYIKNQRFFDLINFTMVSANVTYWMPLPRPPK